LWGTPATHNYFVHRVHNLLGLATHAHYSLPHLHGGVAEIKVKLFTDKFREQPGRLHRIRRIVIHDLHTRMHGCIFAYIHIYRYVHMLLSLPRIKAKRSDDVPPRLETPHQIVDLGASITLRLLLLLL
jgi:hypothetical protein